MGAKQSEREQRADERNKDNTIEIRRKIETERGRKQQRTDLCTTPGSKRFGILSQSLSRRRGNFVHWKINVFLVLLFLIDAVII